MRVAGRRSFQQRRENLRGFLIAAFTSPVRASNGPKRNLNLADPLMESLVTGHCYNLPWSLRGVVLWG